MREVNYLRISVTDRCNLKCFYCMPQNGIEPVRPSDMLSLEDIERLARIFAGLGFKKIRLTGGEPLLRVGIVDLVRRIARLNGIREVCLTTNGVLLADYAVPLRQAGLTSVNVSLDTLQEKKFRAITQADAFKQVMQGLAKIKAAGFSPVKINVVVMNGVNDDEILDFLHYSLENGFIVKFIELMRIAPSWKAERFFPVADIKDRCRSIAPLDLIEGYSSGPAEYYKFKNGIIGFIRTDENLCRVCSRLRMTSTGELKVCLYENEGMSLRDLIRQKTPNGFIRQVIQEKIALKASVSHKNWESSRVYMCRVGG